MATNDRLSQILTNDEMIRRRRKDFIRRMQTRDIRKKPEEHSEGIIPDNPVFDTIGLAGRQIGTAIKNIPQGLVHIGKSAALDARDLATKGDITPERLGHVGEGVVRGTIDDFRHPLRNPGYLLMDLVDIATLGSSTVGTAPARLGRAVSRFKALKKGEDLPVGPRQPLPSRAPDPVSQEVKAARPELTPGQAVKATRLHKETEYVKDQHGNPTKEVRHHKGHVAEEFEATYKGPTRKGWMVVRSDDGHHMEVFVHPKTLTKRKESVLTETDLSLPASLRWKTTKDVGKEAIYKAEPAMEGGRYVGRIVNPLDNEAKYSLWRGNDKSFRVMREHEGRTVPIGEPIQKMPDEDSKVFGNRLRSMFEGSALREAIAIDKDRWTEWDMSVDLDKLNADYDLTMGKPPGGAREGEIQKFDLNNPDALAQAKEWASAQPGGRVTKASLRDRYGVAIPEKEMLDTLKDYGIVNKSGYVIKEAKLKGTKPAASTGLKITSEDLPDQVTIIDEGRLPKDEIDSMVKPGEEYQGHKDTARMEKGRYDPVELRMDEDGQPYVYDGRKRVAAAMDSDAKTIKYVMTEPDEMGQMLPKKYTDTAPTDVSVKPVPKQAKKQTQAARAKELAAKSKSKKVLGGKKQAILKPPKPRPKTNKTAQEMNRQAKKAGGVLDDFKKEVLAAAPEGWTIGDDLSLRNLEGKEVFFKNDTGQNLTFGQSFQKWMRGERINSPDEEIPKGVTVLKPEKPKAAPKVKDTDKAPAGSKFETKQEGKVEVVTTGESVDVTGYRARKDKELAKREAKKGSPLTHVERIVHKTKGEDAKALTVARQIAKETGKPPSAAHISRRTGYGLDSARRIRNQWAEAEKAKIQKKTAKAEPTPKVEETAAVESSTPEVPTAKGRSRDAGTNDRALGLNKRTLQAAGLPENFHGDIANGLRAVIKDANARGVAPSPIKLKEIFTAKLGAAAGEAAYKAWRAQTKKISGGSPAPLGYALKEAIKEFRTKNRGGSYLLAIVERPRGTRGQDITYEIGDTGSDLAAKVKNLEQEEKIERVPVEVPLSDNVIGAGIQKHRYKMMGKDTNSRIVNFYKTMIGASKGRAAKHIEYQIREIDRMADKVAMPVPSKQSVLKMMRTEFATAREQTKNQKSVEGKSNFGRWLDTANQVAILGALYLKPAYLTPNMLGQIFLTGADHWMMPWRVKSSMQTRRATFGENGKQTKAQRELEGKIQAGMQEGIMGSIEVKGGKSANITGVHQAMSMAYSRLMDNWFREISFIHEAKRHGFDTPEKIKSLFDDESLQGKQVEIFRRANKNIIDFGNLKPVEREHLRRAIFFYPWIKASTLYSARFPTRHPLQAAAYIGAGRQAAEETDRKLGDLPSYLEGSFQGPDIDIPFFGNLSERTMPDGSKQPRIINPMAASVFGSLGDLTAMLTANGLTGNVREDEQISDMMSPAMSLISGLVFRRDPFTGREFPQGMSAPNIVLQEAMQYFSAVDTFKDVRDAKKFETGERDPNEFLLPYTAAERLGKFSFGITPVTLNKQEAHSRAAAEDRAASTKFEREIAKSTEDRKDLLEAAKKVGMVKGNQLPLAVRQQMALRARREANLAAYESELDRPLKNVDRLYADLSLLVRMNRISEAAAKKILKQVETLPDNMVEAVARSIRETHFNQAMVSAFRSAVNARRTATGEERLSA